jgi:tRNA dimethylallyltransferase
VRRSIELRAAAQGWPALHAELAGKDPLAAARIQPADRQRIQRALEVIEITGKPLSSLQREDLRGGEDADALKLVLAPADRAAGVAVLAGRLERMMERGFLAEVESLHARGDLGPDLPSIRCVGYRQLWGFLEGQSTLPEAVERAQIATRQLAKRQLTWLRAEPGAEWVDALDTGAIAHIKERVETWLGRFGSTATL